MYIHTHIAILRSIHTCVRFLHIVHVNAMIHMYVCTYSMYSMYVMYYMYCTYICPFAEHYGIRVL